MKNGWSLIELVVVLMVIGILSGMAYPNYIKYVTRARRTAALASLSDCANQMTLYYLQHRTYEGARILRHTSWYDISATATQAHFQCQAKPLTAQAKHDAACGKLSLNDNNQHGISGNGKIATCWFES